MKAISFPFRFEGGSLALTKSYEELVRAQLVDALTTSFHERIMRPQYGADIHSLLFDPTDHLVRSDAANQIKERVGALVPRAVIRDVSIQYDERSPNMVTVNVLYRSRFIDSSLVVTLDLTETPNG